ncbi:hypothetical protein PGTUg99_000570 [Puccinia graminis f. sp. tritici]|uniref:Uncharacterized protein n=1 Tax=Puccinia graminis f. sp. tritici TaxID=56615 RepID=A0A5B0P6P0_PUCGR|nr:hypothetical protein PGTUg99_006375 [Puccinia graminis f. sp. tritici]KAA1127570.1 hypothetical protein PGTUg99_000570 [Puccinia graminis f. sp. tritici]
MYDDGAQRNLLSFIHQPSIERSANSRRHIEPLEPGCSYSVQQPAISFLKPSHIFDRTTKKWHPPKDPVGTPAGLRQVLEVVMSRPQMLPL